MSQPKSAYPAKKNTLSTQIHSHSIVKSTSSVPSVREVNPLLVVSEPSSNLDLITAYKDLDAESKHRDQLKKFHFSIAVAVFTVLAIGIVLGQKYDSSRKLASVNLKTVVPAGAEISASEHYHFDKTCYVGSSGEQVCMTRTSQQR